MNGSFLTVPEVARRLRLQRTRAYELVQTGFIPAVRIGSKSIRVPASWVEDLERQALARLRQEGGGR